ncbi:MAG: hypothetical protein OER89_09940, partial [Gemmatimonadota bacterium]|nr:hypothetical protein [Gemmatimonadota bacterium]
VTDARPLPIAQGTRRWLGPGVLAAAVLIVIAVVLFRMMAPGPITITASNIKQVTSQPGIEFQPALSPDGSEVAYVVGPRQTPRIAMKSTVDIGGGSGLRLSEAGSELQWLPAWTPEGASLRFWACGAGGAYGPGSGCQWKEVGKLGGPVRTVGVPRESDRYAWSRDGTRVAFVAGDSIFAYSADQDERQLLGVHVSDRYAPLHSLAWSPDGRMIAYVRGNAFWTYSQNALAASIWILDLHSGERVQVTDAEYLNVSPQWLPDSRHLLFVSSRDGPRGIYVVEVGPDGSRGPPRSVLSSSDPHSISISADGRRLAYAKFPSAQNVWSIPIPRSGVVSIREAIPVTTGNQLVESHDLSPDGERIVYESTLLGSTDIWTRPLTGGDATMIANLPGYAFSPQWSPDGSEIAFHSVPPDSGAARIFVVPATGGVPDPLEDMPGDDAYPVWSPDGLAIAFSSFPPGTPGAETWVVTRDRVGGDWGVPVQLTDSLCGYPQWDVDGTSLVCKSGRELVRVSRSGEVLARYDRWTATLQLLGPIRFSPDGSRMYGYFTEEDGTLGVWWIAADGGDATKVVAFDDPSLTVWGFLTVGPERLYLTIADYESDIWVMDLEW